MWLGDKLCDVLPTKLPLLDEGTARRFLADVRQVVTARGWTVTSETSSGAKLEELARPKANGAGHDPNGPYARAALDRECDAVANSTEGTRNDTLNRAAFNLFQLVAGGELNQKEVSERLTAAATACGLTEDDGVESVGKTIASGAKAGRMEPRHAPERDRDEQPRSSAKANGDPETARTNKHVTFVRAEVIEQRPIDWLWNLRLARGKIALIAGDPGVGKSSVIADIVARSSAARMWPDAGFAPRGNCIILSAEDAADDTICPRLEIAGADMSHVFLMRMAGKPGTRLTFSIGQDLPLLATAIEQLGDAILLAIDPITAYLGDRVDTHQTAAVRAVLEPLDAFAAYYRCAIFAVTHPPKAMQSKAINAFTGSLAFVAAARTAFVAVEEPQTDRRLLLPVKSNVGPLAPGIAYRLVPAQTSKGIAGVRVEWDSEPVKITANEAIYAAAEDARGGGQKREAEEFLEAYLEAQPMPVEKVQAAAKANGISERTLDRAKKSLRIVSEKDEFRGGWRWRLPR